ncbi:MAG: VanZ family protein, partial [Planctomycetota bacterium]
MHKLKNYFDIKWLVLVITFTATVIVLTHIPQKLMPSQMQESGVDKLLHFLAYGVITFLLILSVKSSPSPRLILFVFFALLAIGIVDEITQPLVRRQASLTDLMADITGVVSVLLLFIVGKHQFQKIKIESVSRLCFTAVVAFIAGILFVPATLYSLNKLSGPRLQQQQKEAKNFFYRTMDELFKGSYNPEKGLVSQDTLDTFFIYDDWFSRNRQKAGYFSGPVFFPSGDMYTVERQRRGKHFVLKKLSPADWEQIWIEEVRKSKK